MKPSERIRASIAEARKATPLVLCSAPCLNDAVEEICKILDEFSATWELPDFHQAPGLFYEQLVLRVDDMPPGARRTLFALLNERYDGKGERRT